MGIRYDIISAMLVKYKKFLPLHFATLILALPFAITHISDIEGAIKYAAVFFVNLFCLQSYVPLGSVYFSYNGVSWYLGIVILNAAVYELLKRRKNILKSKATIPALLATIAIWDTVWSIADLPYTHWAVYVFPVARSLEYIFVLSISYRYALSKGSDSSNSTDGQAINKYVAALWAAEIAMLAAFPIIFTYISNHGIAEMLVVIPWIIPSGVIALFPVIGRKTDPSSIYWFSKKIKSAFISVGNVSMELFLTHQLAIRYAAAAMKRMGIDAEILMLGAKVGFILVFLSIALACKSKRNDYALSG